MTRGDAIRLERDERTGKVAFHFYAVEGDVDGIRASATTRARAKYLEDYARSAGLPSPVVHVGPGGLYYLANGARDGPPEALGKTERECRRKLTELSMILDGFGDLLGPKEVW
jgi:hypothetical protein